MLAGNISNRAYDTEPYEAFITIYWFDVFDSPHRVGEPNTQLKTLAWTLLPNVKAHQRATALGLTSDGRWKNPKSNYATREYRTENDARRLVVIERS